MRSSGSIPRSRAAALVSLIRRVSFPADTLLNAAVVGGCGVGVQGVRLRSASARRFGIELTHQHQGLTGAIRMLGQPHGERVGFRVLHDSDPPHRGSVRGGFGRIELPADLRPEVFQRVMFKGNRTDAVRAPGVPRVGLNLDAIEQVW